MTLSSQSFCSTTNALILAQVRYIMVSRDEKKGKVVQLPPRPRHLDSGSPLGQKIKSAEAKQGIDPFAGFPLASDDTAELPLVGDDMVEFNALQAPLGDSDDGEFKKTDEFRSNNPPTPPPPPKSQVLALVSFATIILMVVIAWVGYVSHKLTEDALHEMRVRQVALATTSVDLGSSVYHYDSSEQAANLATQEDVMSVNGDAQTHVTKVVASSRVNLATTSTSQAEETKPVDVAEVAKAPAKPEPQPIIALDSHTDVKASMELADDEDDGEYIYHIMMKGDTPASLARRYFISRWKIYHLNKKLQRAALLKACKKNYADYLCTPNDRWFHRMVPGTKVFIRLKSEVQIRVAEVNSTKVTAVAKTVEKTTNKNPRKTFLSKASEAEKVGKSVVRVTKSDTTWVKLCRRTGLYMWGRLYHDNVSRLMGDCLNQFPQSKGMRCNNGAWTSHMRAGTELLLPRKKKLRRRPNTTRKKKAEAITSWPPRELRYSQKDLGSLASVWVVSQQVYYLLVGESYGADFKASQRTPALRRARKLHRRTSVTSDKSGSSSHDNYLEAMVFSDLPTPKKNRIGDGHTAVF